MKIHTRFSRTSSCDTFPATLTCCKNKSCVCLKMCWTSTMARRNPCRKSCKPTSTRRNETLSMLISSSQSQRLTSEPGRELLLKSSIQPPSLTWWSSPFASASSANSVCVSAPTAANILRFPGGTQRSSAISLLTRTCTLAERWAR